MMKKQLLLLVMMMMPFVASAYDIAVQNADGVTIYYTYTNDAKELMVVTFNGSGTSYQGNVVIPEEVTYMNRTRKVTSIGGDAFVSCYGLTSVTIPNSVTSIGDYAFQGCSGLTSATIGSGVTSIGNNAFEDCSGLKKVVISDIAAWCGIEYRTPLASPLYYGGHLYSDENTKIKDLVIPNSVTSIGYYAFLNCSGIISVTIPNSVTTIPVFNVSFLTQPHHRSR